METNSWKTWAAVIALSLGVVGAVFYLRPELRDRFFPTEDATSVASEDVPQDSPNPTKKKKKKKRYSAASSATNALDPENFVDDYEPEDNFAIGNVFDEADEPEEAVQPEPEFVPPPDMWQPDGPYKPTARWAAPGATENDIVEISMTGGASQPLTGTQISKVLNERVLMPCYEDVARKVPQMNGQVMFKIAIDGTGTPSRVDVKRSALRSRIVEQCMVDTIRNLRFPASVGQQKTRFDIDFTFH